jgi:hypothetical protein
MQLIDTIDKTRDAISRDDRNIPLVAGSFRIYNKLANAGLNVTAAPDYKKTRDAEALVQDIATVLMQLEPVFERDSTSDRLVSFLKADLVKRLFSHPSNQIDSKSDVLDSFLSLSEENIERIGEELSNCAALINQRYRNLFNPFFHFRRDNILDFRSSSGKQNSKETLLVTLSGKHDRLFGISNWSANTLRAISGKQNRFRFDVGAHKVGYLGNSKRSAGAYIISLATEFYRWEAALSSLLRSSGDVPHKALFNHVGNVSTAGCASALINADIESHLSSHGAMIEHGSKARHIVSAALGNCIYNSYPGMHFLKPRSPLQVPKEWPSTRIVREPRCTQPADSRSERPFSILYAPNFLSWWQCYHGLVPSCYETRKCAEGLVEAISKIENAILNIRIKTTVNDVAKQSDANEIRGILPEDFNDLYNNDVGVFDASLGSHKSLLSEADVVISEGVTAVLFEALEHRKPLLLLNQDAGRTPTLPAKRFEDLLRTGKRSAVYASGIEDTLPSLIAKIRELHLGKPLTNEELAPYIWV